MYVRESSLSSEAEKWACDLTFQVETVIKKGYGYKIGDRIGEEKNCGNQRVSLYTNWYNESIGFSDIVGSVGYLNFYLKIDRYYFHFIFILLSVLSSKKSSTLYRVLR